MKEFGFGLPFAVFGLHQKCSLSDARCILIIFSLDINDDRMFNNKETKKKNTNECSSSYHSIDRNG